MPGTPMSMLMSMLVLAVIIVSVTMSAFLCHNVILFVENNLVLKLLQNYNKQDAHLVQCHCNTEHLGQSPDII